MPTPGTVERPVERDADRKVGEEFDFFCAACGTLAEGDLADALLGGARRVHLGQDGKIDWQSEPGA
jgi:hypothetical protein